jgi:hypothetical protein
VPDKDGETKEIQRFHEQLHLGKKPYTGLLTKPLEPDEAWLELTPEHDPIAARLDALFAHYEIDQEEEDGWKRLALCLALAHIPGFQPTPIQGRSRTRGRDDINLIMVVHALQQRHGSIKTEAAALRALLEAKVYTDSFETLKRRYIRAKKRYSRQMPAIIKKANSFIEEEPNTRTADDAISKSKRRLPG